MGKWPEDRVAAGDRKRILGDRLLARDADAQSVEARLACSILNRMTELGMPASFAVRM
jgi:hypothetical protein